MNRRVCASLLLFATLASAPAAAQVSSLGLIAGGAGYMARHRTHVQDSVLEQTGVWFGGQGLLRVGPLILAGRGLMGKLSGDAAVTNPDRTVRVTTVSAQYAVTPTLALGAALEARRTETDVDVTVWKLLGPAVRFAPSFGVPGLVGLVDVRYFAVVTLPEGVQEKMSVALEADLGVSYTAPASGLTISVGYRLERFDFSAVGTAPARLEQVSGLTVGVGLRLGR